MTLCTLLLAASGAPSSGSPQDPSPTAPAGYVADAACASCHAEIAVSYQQVGMARSFSRPEEAAVIEDFEASLEHTASGRFYGMRRDSEGYVFTRRMELADGSPRFDIEIPVAWILGSGHTSRTYLYTAPSGELFQLPIAWYSQEGRWGMAPGYDNPEHPGLSRRVRRECMFCHNAYPAVEAGSDAYGEAPLFPTELPRGTGCQRCHGPGAEHVEQASAGAPELVLRNTIVNPARLAPERARDVCYQCHMQPSVALFGARLFGRGDYSFRPGQALGEYRVLMDVDEAHRERSERFEINHHPYRLEQSPCFQQSAGALSCLNCHDPHRKVAPSERAAHYRQACLDCHPDAGATQLAESPKLASHQAPQSDCVSCHMPRRRTHDVVGVTMTDHYIDPSPTPSDLLAPREETTPILTGIEITDPHGPPAGHLAEIYKATTVARIDNGVSQAAVDRLSDLLRRFPVPEVEPYLDLAQGELTHERWRQAVATLDAAETRRPGLALTAHLRGIAESSLGHTARAIEFARSATTRNPNMAEAHLNLGLYQRDALAPEKALEPMRRAIELRPHFATAWLELGKTYVAVGESSSAREAFRQAARIEPSLAEASARLESLAGGEDPRPSRSAAAGSE